MRYCRNLNFFINKVCDKVDFLKELGKNWLNDWYFEVDIFVYRLLQVLFVK